MAHLKRIAQLVGGALAFLVYVWFAAVRHAPAVKRRKALLRPPRRK